MDFSIKNAMSVMLYIVVVSACMSSLFKLYLDLGNKTDVNVEKDYFTSNVNEGLDTSKSPTLTVTSQIIKKGTSIINLKNYATAYDPVTKKSINDRITVYGTVDTSKVGDYVVKYSVQSESGMITTKLVKFYVVTY